MKNWLKRSMVTGFFLALLLVASAGASAGTMNQTVVDGRNAATNYYSLSHKTLTGYWDVWGAYATHGTNVLMNNGYVYDSSLNDPLQLGANALAVIMMGGDPYNYNGKNLMADVIAKGTQGSFSIPVFNFLAQQAAGVDMSEATEKAFIDYCCNEISTLDQGPDIGGWAIVALTPYLDHPAYKKEINDAIVDYLNVVGKQVTSGTSGSGGLTAGCVVTGLTALLSANADPADYDLDDGIILEGFDVTADKPWTTQTTLPLPLMLKNLQDGEKNVSSVYNCQYCMEFSDLYKVLSSNGKPAWLSCGVTADKLSALKTKANTLLNNKSLYTSISVTQLQTALNAVNAVTADELIKTVPTWGEEYYALYHAVNNCKEKGKPAVMTDLDSSKWYKDFVYGVIEEGLMNGTSPTTFAPDATLTRAMMVQILYNMAGRPSYSAANPFKDVSEGQWYAAAVLWANENKVTTGTSPTTFEPDTAVTRQQLVTLICRYAEKMGIKLNAGTVPAFADDGAIDEYAKDYVYILVNEGIVSGVGNGMFAPKATATRAQVAKIVNLLTQVKEG